ncbi:MULTISPECIES: hypothetical protein [Pseudomonas]|jgi:hypothetical protein|uniref:Uncharacterized protein n=2 Tax=Pseudomonas putida TaxID=303 RepID=A0A140FW43_PSEPK|nr:MULTISPECIES: hypothetical protein [Pseudomonas]AMM02826.1 conserved protein of unknown function [Pseudomonas putida KT2440]KAF0251165.1 hypothetical protein GN299_29930 [Pseudomonas putida]KMU96606.1 hypothetical protein AC138_07665 [Pseudomonas putida]KMY35931.1 hypothetical protein AA993_09975 [Pseudomonas putida]MDD2080749.1 hypothetical protein [Pseudomonas putida]
MFRMMPANEDGLLEKLRYSLSGSLEIRFGHPLFILRSIVSSPRLKDIFVREFPVQDLVPVGDTYLDKHTMLADENQKTYGISLAEWQANEGTAQIVTDFDFRDATVAKLQVWPFDPLELDEDQLRIAVAVSFNEFEVFDEPRLSLALSELLECLNITTDYTYKFN